MRKREILANKAYEDATGKIRRSVVSIYPEKNWAHSRKMVTYKEFPATQPERFVYLMIDEPKHMSLTQFAQWAARRVDDPSKPRPAEIPYPM
jgi:hypothetical protein